MTEAASGGGTVSASYAPMDGLTSQLSGQASAWIDGFASQLGTSGNPTLDAAISDLGGQFRAAVGQLAGASQATSKYVSTTASNFHSADGNGK